MFNDNNNNRPQTIQIIIFNYLKVGYLSLLKVVMKYVELHTTRHLRISVCPGIKTLSSSACAGATCVCVTTQIFSSSAHLQTHLQHGGGFSEGGCESPTLQLQRDGEGQQVHHSDVRKHHKSVCVFKSVWVYLKLMCLCCVKMCFAYCYLTWMFELPCAEWCLQSFRRRNIYLYSH